MSQNTATERRQVGADGGGRKTSTAAKSTRNISPLGRGLKIQRERKMMTQKELAEATGVSQASISRLEEGSVQSMQSSRLRHLASILGVTTDFLLSGAEGTFDPGDSDQLQRRVGELELRVAAREISERGELGGFGLALARHSRQHLGLSFLGGDICWSGHDFSAVDAGCFFGDLQAFSQVATDNSAFAESLRESWKFQKSMTRQVDVASEDMTRWVSSWGQIQHQVQEVPEHLWVIDLPFSQGVIRAIFADEESQQQSRQHHDDIIALVESAVRSIGMHEADRLERAEARQRIELLEGLANSAPHPMFAVDSLGRFLFANDKLVDLSGVERSHLTMRSADLTVKPNDGRSVTDLVQANPTQPVDYVASVAPNDEARYRFHCRPISLPQDKIAWLHAGTLEEYDEDGRSMVSVREVKDGLNAVLMPLMHLMGTMDAQSEFATVGTPAQASKAVELALSISRLSRKSRQMIDAIVRNLEEDGDIPSS